MKNNSSTNMKKLIQESALLFFAIVTLFLGACSSKLTPPVAMPAPPMISAIMTIEAGSEILPPVIESSTQKRTIKIAGTVTIAAGEFTEIDIYITNASTEDTIIVAPEEDGSFEAVLSVLSEDLIIIVAVDSIKGQRSNAISGSVPAVSEESAKDITIVFGPADKKDYDEDGYSDAVDEFPTDPNN